MFKIFLILSIFLPATLISKNTKITIADDINFKTSEYSGLTSISITANYYLKLQEKKENYEKYVGLVEDFNSKLKIALEEFLPNYLGEGFWKGKKPLSMIVQMKNFYPGFSTGMIGNSLFGAGDGIAAYEVGLYSGGNNVARFQVEEKIKNPRWGGKDGGKRRQDAANQIEAEIGSFLSMH